MPSVASREHVDRTFRLRSLLSAHARCEDLIRIGAYSKGSDAELDRAIAVLPQLQAFLRQRPEERVSFSETQAALNQISC